MKKFLASRFKISVEINRIKYGFLRKLVLYCAMKMQKWQEVEDARAKVILEEN